MPKITFIGAGSTIFAKNLLSDILGFPELAEATISLHDIDEQRLSTSEVVAYKVADALDANPTIEATTDRRRALDGADYAIGMFQIGGYKPSTVIDFEVPKAYGLRQTIADTLGIGGIMRGLRTIPVMLEMCRDMEELCPNVTFLNYVNPMAINCWAVNRASSISTVGLCHSVPHTAHQLAGDLGVPFEELEYVVAGINHMAFFLKLRHDGKDLYPQLRTIAESGNIPQRDHEELGWAISDAVRYEVFKKLGYFVTESSEHFAEYVPWFIKRNRPDLLEKYELPLDEYIRRCELQIAGWEYMREELENSDAPIEIKRSVEYGSLIIHSMETGTQRRVYANIANEGIIDNLPAGCCVEVPCLVDENGVQPTKIGTLPPQLAALMRTNINVQELTVEAALTRRRDHIYHAAMLDPHTAAELDVNQICSLVDDLIDAHGEMLPEYH